MSYYKLKSIAKAFKYPVPQCADAVTVIMTGSSVMYIITAYARQLYQQV